MDASLWRPRTVSAKRHGGSLKRTDSDWLTLAAMSLGYGVVQLDVTIVNTALNSIGGALGGGISGLQITPIRTSGGAGARSASGRRAQVSR